MSERCAYICMCMFAWLWVHICWSYVQVCMCVNDMEAWVDVGDLLLWPFHFIYWRRVSQANPELIDVVRQTSMWGSRFCFPGICKADTLTTKPSPASNLTVMDPHRSVQMWNWHQLPHVHWTLWAGTHSSCKWAGCCQEETPGQEIALAVGKKGRQLAEKSSAEVNHLLHNGNSKQGLHRHISKKLCVPEI